MLESLITSKTRLRLLIKFFMNVNDEGYLRGLASDLNESSNGIRKELINLQKAGILTRNEQKVTGNQIVYKVNAQNPFFGLIQKLIFKHVGFDNLAKIIFENCTNLHRIFVIGDYAKGMDTGTIEVVIEGDALSQKNSFLLSQKIEDEIHKKTTLFYTNCHDNSGLLIFEHV